MDRTRLRLVKRHIMSWGTGTSQPVSVPAGTVATIALADRTHLQAVLESGIAGADTVILAPGADDEATGVVGYAGSLSEPGADLAVGDDFFLQIQDYASSRFMSVLGPTLLRITCGDDLDAFLADADTAFTSGVFPDFAITPPVRITDLPALGAGPAEGGPMLRLYVGPDGGISTSPGGVPLAQVGAPLDEIVAAWEQANAASDAPCAVSLGAVVPEEERSAALLSRPFIGRYLVALEALRMMTANEVTGVRVSGFGGRLNPDLGVRTDACDFRDPQLPMVLWTDDQAYVYDTAGRVFAMDRQSAMAVECLIASGDSDIAAEFVPPAALTRVGGFLTDRGVRLGTTEAEHGVRPGTAEDESAGAR
ncbi:daptide biosynthesis RiPP recognition protein [Actinoplanes sp. NPDC051859]|uniref:daptide biosynthesis RiPP recognition protein n=1 Tax=Actinoplanes sp. NPDC051859 TaxID=3363909 RepID=UPI0037936583